MVPHPPSQDPLKAAACYPVILLPSDLLKEEKTHANENVFFKRQASLKQWKKYSFPMSQFIMLPLRSSSVILKVVSAVKYDSTVWQLLRIRLFHDSGDSG